MLNFTRPKFASGISTKRKRSMSEETSSSIDYETYDLKCKKDLAALRSPISPKEAEHEEEVNDMSENPYYWGFVYDTLETQFSFEIVLKHNELRLISQELAKSQVALEQLRRCHLIPYPTNIGTAESMLNVSNGTGPSISQDKNVPQWAPPYGVTDGPYTRHYAKWLIPDPNFDGISKQSGSESRAEVHIPEGRATRNSHVEGTTRASKTGLRGNTAQKLHALSSGYPQVKDKVGPCVLKRGDGKTVKLVCLDCHRENFSSTQGFINHCRIAHRRDFKSHEEAAVASGNPIEIDEFGNVIGDQRGTPNSLVHPFIKSAPTGKEAIEACRALLCRVADSKAMLREGRLPGFSSIPSSVTTTSHSNEKSFVHSSSTPHLSEFLHRKGFAGDLNEMVLEAQQQLNSDDPPTEDESDDLEKLPFQGTQICESNSSLPQSRMPAPVK